MYSGKCGKGRKWKRVRKISAEKRMKQLRVKCETTTRRRIAEAKRRAKGRGHGHGHSHGKKKKHVKSKFEIKSTCEQKAANAVLHEMTKIALGGAKPIARNRTCSGRSKLEYEP